MSAISSSVARWVVSRLAPYKRSLSALLAMSAVEIALRVASPWTVKAAIDFVFASMPAPAWLNALSQSAARACGWQPRASLLFLIVGLGMIGHVGQHLVVWIHARAATSIAQRLTRDLRKDLFGHLQCLALTHHARVPASDAVYRLSADATCVEHLVLRAAMPGFTATVALVTMFGVLTALQPLLAFVSLAVVPGLWLSLRLHARRVAGEAARVKALESNVIQRAQESLFTIRLVKSFARETYERQRFSGVVRTATTARVDLTKREAGFSFIVGLLTAAGTSLVLAVGGMLVVDGIITAGTLLLVLTYLTFIYGPLATISHATGIVRDAAASAERVCQMLAIAPEHMDASGDGAPMPRLRGDIRFEAVGFEYDSGEPVLQDVSFNVVPGELIAVVGPSGSGKTTLTSLLMRLYEPTRGRILLDGVDARRYSLQAQREQFAVVLQDALLLSGSVRENLRYARLDATDAEVERAAIDAHAHDFIMSMPDGYDTQLIGGAELSGGQKQRLSIARAFLKDAPIMVLDEPTSALDSMSEAQFIEALGRLRAGRTTFVIAHRMTTVRAADRILVLDGGRIVASGTHAELLASSALYAQLAGDFADQPGTALRTRSA